MGRGLVQDELKLAGRERTALQTATLVGSLKLVRCIMRILKEDSALLNQEISKENCQETDALTLALWNYNIPVVKVFNYWKFVSIDIYIHFKESDCALSLTFRLYSTRSFHSMIGTTFVQGYYTML